VVEIQFLLRSGLSNHRNSQSRLRVFRALLGCPGTPRWWQMTASKLRPLNGKAWPSAAIGQKDGSPNLPRAFKHRGRDVRTNDDAGGADDREYRQRGRARSGGDIQNTGPWGYLSSGDHRRHEKARLSANPAVICRGINATTHGNVKARPETGAHCRLRSTALVEGSGVSPIMCWRGVMWQLPSGSLAFAVSRPELSDTEQTHVRREHPPK
jgi:hypothetical protein